MRTTFTYAGPVVYHGTMVEKIISDEKHVSRDFRTPAGIAATRVLKEDDPGFIYFDNEHGRLVESGIRSGMRRSLRAATVITPWKRCIIYQGWSIKAVRSGKEKN